MGNLEDFSPDDLSITSERLAAMWKSQINETDTTESLKTLLSDHFVIKEQVRGSHFASSRPKRIDFVIQPIRNQSWANPDVAIGIEIKKDFVEDKSTGDFCRHFGQSVDYANTEWEGFGFIYVLTYPSFIPRRIADAGFFRRLAGRLGVGTLEHAENLGLVININGHHVWSSRYGVIEKTWKLTRKFGSR